MANIGNWIIFLGVILGILWVFKNKKEKDDDAKIDYGEKDLGGKIGNLSWVGTDTYLWFTYTKRQPNKMQYILDRYKQAGEIFAANGDEYIISQTVGEEVYEVVIANGKEHKKSGPYIIYKLIPAPEVARNRTTIDNSTNIRTGNILGQAQIVSNSSDVDFSAKQEYFFDSIIRFKDLMISHGIPSEDIEAVLVHQNEYVKKSFLERHALDIAKIIVQVSGVGVSLLDVLIK